VLYLSNRSLSWFQLTLVALGGLIGAGLFVGSGTAIATVGPAVLVSYGLAGGVLLSIVHLMVQMRRQVPDALFITDFVCAGLGARCGWVAALIYWCFWALVITVDALAGANILAPDGGLPAFIAAIGILLVTAGASQSLSASMAEIEIGFAALKVGVMVAFIALAVSHLATNHLSSELSAAWWRESFAPRGIATLFAGVITTFFSLAGVEIVHAVANTTPSQLTSHHATSLIAVRVFVIYVISVALVLTIIGWDAVRPGFSPFTLALKALDHARASHWLSAVILAAVLATLSSALEVCSKIFLKLKPPSGWLMPGNDTWTQTSSRVLTTVFSLAVLCLAALWPANAYPFLLNAASVLLAVVYVLFVLATQGAEFSFERTGDDVGRGSGRWGRYALLASLVGALLSMAWVPPLAKSLATGLGVVLLVTVLEVTASRRRGGG
jgi:GABA permease